MMSFSEDHVRAIDQLRQRLSTLSNSLGTLKTDLERNDPLPTWPSLQNSAQLTAHNLGQLMATFQARQEFFKAAHAYPLPSFPGHSQEGLLQVLLRKKLEPRVEDWIEQYTAEGLLTQGGGAPQGSQWIQGTRVGLQPEKLAELWSWAGATSNGIMRTMIDDGIIDDDFTIAEREEGVQNVVTGLKRKLWDEENQDDSEGEDSEMDENAMPSAKAPTAPLAGVDEFDTTKPMIPLESVLKFMSTSEIPSTAQKTR